MMHQLIYHISDLQNAKLLNQFEIPKSTTWTLPITKKTEVKQKGTLSPFGTPLMSIKD